MATIKNANKAFITKLQCLYDIETVIERALPKMEKAATDKALKEGFKTHLAETKGQIKRLEQAFKILGTEPKKTKCEGIRGIIADGEWVIGLDTPTTIKDAMLAGSARYVEHYEIAGYKSAILEADALDLDDIVDLLNETLDEEQATDEKLADAMEENLEAQAEQAEE